MTMFATSTRCLAAFAGGLAAPAVEAHPGHDAATTMSLFEGLVHLLTQPDHVAMLVLAVVAGIVGAKAWRARRAARRPDASRRR